MRWLVLPLAIAGCTAVQVGGRDEDSLATELAGRVPGEPRRCISATAGQVLTVLDRTTLVYRSGGTIWVNRLQQDCRGMKRHSPLVIEVNGSQYCHGDRVRAIEPGIAIPGPICVLQDFTPYTRRD